MPLVVIPASASQKEELDNYYDDTVQQYQQYDYADPNIITDEELFGKWEDDSWSIEPLLDYDNYPEMSAVLEMAQNGDYEGAKDAILEFYRNGPFKNYKYLDPGTDGTAVNNRAKAEALMENMYFFGNGQPYAKVTLKSFEVYDWKIDNVATADATAIVAPESYEGTSVAGNVVISNIDAPESGWQKENKQVIICEYKADSSLNKVTSVKLSVYAGEAVALSGTYEPMADTAKVKFFAWEADGSLVPLVAAKEVNKAQ